jgi:glycosyltransferase involved in cell wall biosynthesis
MAKGRDPLISWGQLSVVLITRSAAEVLPAALASIPSDAELIVADDDSKDGTVEIARAAGAKVIRQDRQAVVAAEGNFDVARNHAAKACTRPWVFFLDADERVSAELAREITEAIDRATATSAFDMPRVNLFWGQAVRLLGEDRQLRLMRRGRGLFEGVALHRSPRISGPVGHLDAPIVHDNVRSLRDVVRRFRLYVPIEARSLQPVPSMVDVLRIPLRMFRYYYLQNQAWRDGAIGLTVSAIYALQHGAVAWKTRRISS